MKIDKQKLLTRLNEYRERCGSYMRTSTTDHIYGYFEGRRDQAEWIILEIERGDFDKEDDK